MVDLERSGTLGCLGTLPSPARSDEPATIYKCHSLRACLPTLVHEAGDTPPNTPTATSLRAGLPPPLCMAGCLGHFESLAVSSYLGANGQEPPGSVQCRSAWPNKLHHAIRYNGS